MSVAQALTPITNDNIQTAVDSWTVTSPMTAEYGPIADWNTAAVSCIYGLFNKKPTFNGDISKWNVASVANMR